MLSLQILDFRHVTLRSGVRVLRLIFRARCNNVEASFEKCLKRNAVLMSTV